VVALVAARCGQSLYGYPTLDGWMPLALLWGLYGRIDQLDALAIRHQAQAVNLSQEQFSELAEVAYPDGW
jgi:hypothetical protein